MQSKRSKKHMNGIKPLHEKNVYYTYLGYSFIAEWNTKDETYTNEIISPKGIRYINHNNSLDAIDFNRVTSADICSITKNTITIKEFATIINKWEEYNKNGYR